MNTKENYSKNNILLCGDIHGDVENILSLIEIAKKYNCSCLMVMGDFGCYHNIPSFVSFMTAASKSSIDKDIPIHFIKGNHENHDVLKSYRKTSEVEKNIFYHPNMNVFTIGNTTFLPVGGANSVDKAFRKKGYDWFPNELITVEEYIKCADINGIDVVLSHDCPLGVVLNDRLQDFYPDTLTTKNRRLLQDIIDEINPKLLVHGHYHIKYKDKSFGKNITPVIGLGCNNNINDQWIVFDTNSSIERQV